MTKKGTKGICQPSRTDAQDRAVAKAVAATRRKWALPSHALAVVAWNNADPETRGPRPRHPRSAANKYGNARAMSLDACTRIGMGIARLKRAKAGPDPWATEAPPITATPVPPIHAPGWEPPEPDEDADPRFPRRKRCYPT